MNDLDPHLLVVDDDERIRSLLKKFLMRNGFLVSTARDAAHARRVLAGLEFDLIVLDVMMPGEDGMALTRALRETLQTPILLLTAKGETDNRIEGLRPGRMTTCPSPLSQKNCCCASTPSCGGCPTPLPPTPRQRCCRSA